jgi:hypothetical protein
MDGGGINIDTDTFLIIRVERVRFFRVTTESIRCDGPGIYIDDCDFQEMEKVKSLTRGHIHIPSTRGTGSDIRINDCRWGNEGNGIDTDVPRWAITVGDPENPANVTTSICGALHISGNRFGGRNNVAPADSNHGQATVGLFGRVEGLRFVDNVVLNQGVCVIDDDYIINNSGGSYTSGGINSIYSNNFDSNVRNVANLPVFKNGGYPFKVELLESALLVKKAEGSWPIDVYGGDANGILGWNGEGLLINAYNSPTKKMRLRVSSTGAVVVDEQVGAPYTNMGEGSIDI